MSDSVSKYFENANTTIPVDLRQTDKIVDDVISRFKQRSEVGVQKYGTTLYNSPDGFYSFLNHLLEELMDATLYIEKLKQLK